MSKKAKAGKPANVAKAKSKKPAAKAARKKVAAEKAVAPAALDFIGRVDSIRVQSGVSGTGFEFVLHGRKGVRQAFRLRAEDGPGMLTMAQVVIAAHEQDAKIGVRSEKQGEGVPLAAEIILRAKLGKAG